MVTITTVVKETKLWADNEEYMKIKRIITMQGSHNVRKNPLLLD